jgi:signal transduction histidine kinase
LADLEAGRWDERGLLESLTAAERTFPELRPMVMIDPDGDVIYPSGRQETVPALPRGVLQTTLSGDDSYAWLLDRAWQSETVSKDLRTAERLYRRAVGVAEDDAQRVRVLHALARTHLKANEPDLATATWERMLELADPLDPELARWGLIGRIGLAQAAAAVNRMTDAAEHRVDMLEYLTEHRFGLDPDVYTFYRGETETALAAYELNANQRERVQRLMAQKPELDQIATAMSLLIQQAPQLGGMDRAVVVATLDASRAVDTGSGGRTAPEWSIAYLNLPGDTTGSTVISARGNTGWRLLRRWRPDSVKQLLRGLLLQPGPWRNYGVALLDPTGAVVFASTPTVPTDRVASRVNLNALPGWRIAAYPRDGSIDDAARQDVLDYSVLLAAAFLAVVGGLILATRTMSREVALARTRSDFVSNVSHELKTPLALIRMFAENLRAGWVPDAKRSEYYEVMLSESERLSGVIDNVLDFSRMEQGRREFHLRSTDVTALISRILERYRYSFETANIELHAVLPDHAIVADVDRDGLAQVLVNLLSNATKYIGEGTKEVIVTLTEADDQFVMTVQDTGVGMNADSIQEIFAPFTRIDDPEVHSVAGSGIGLTIVRHIIDAHHGHIEVESELHAGSTFRVSLPLHSRPGGTHDETQVEESR